jgi:hypothetical protein
MVKTQQLMRFGVYTIPALDDTIRGFFAIFCHLRSSVNPIFLTPGAKLPQFRHKRSARTATAAGRDGAYQGEFAMIMDITSRRKAEEAERDL